MPCTAARRTGGTLIRRLGLGRHVLVKVGGGLQRASSSSSSSRCGARQQTQMHLLAERSHSIGPLRLPATPSGPPQRASSGVKGQCQRRCARPRACARPAPPSRACGCHASTPAPRRPGCRAAPPGRAPRPPPLQLGRVVARRGSGGLHGGRCGMHAEGCAPAAHSRGRDSASSAAATSRVSTHSPGPGSRWGGRGRGAGCGLHRAVVGRPGGGGQKGRGQGRDGRRPGTAPAAPHPYPPPA